MLTRVSPGRSRNGLDLLGSYVFVETSAIRDFVNVCVDDASFGVGLEENGVCPSGFEKDAKPFEEVPKAVKAEVVFASGAAEDDRSIGVEGSLRQRALSPISKPLLPKAGAAGAMTYLLECLCAGGTSKMEGKRRTARGKERGRSSSRRRRASPGQVIWPGTTQAGEEEGSVFPM